MQYDWSRYKNQTTINRAPNKLPHSLWMCDEGIVALHKLITVQKP